MKTLILCALSVALLAAVAVGAVSMLSRPQTPSAVASVVDAPAVPPTASSPTAVQTDLTDADLLEAVGEDGDADDLPTVVSDFDAKKFGLDEGDTLKAENGRIFIDVGPLQKDKVHFYNVGLPEGGQVFFFVVRDAQGQYRAALNACQVCWGSKKGFHQEGNEMVCNTCGNRYPLEKIAMEKGGCNPIPINPKLPVENGKAQLRLADLQEFAAAF